MSEELKPCPFCGGEAQVRSYGKSTNYVRCGACKGRTWGCYGTEQEAIDAWNTRHERTCRVVSSKDMYDVYDYYVVYTVLTLSCGHEAITTGPEGDGHRPCFCSVCRAKVVG